MEIEGKKRLRRIEGKGDYYHIQLHMYCIYKQYMYNVIT